MSVEHTNMHGVMVIPVIMTCFVNLEPQFRRLICFLTIYRVYLFIWHVYRIHWRYLHEIIFYTVNFYSERRCEDLLPTRSTVNMKIPIDLLLSQTMKALLNNMTEKVDIDVSIHSPKLTLTISAHQLRMRDKHKEHLLWEWMNWASYRSVMIQSYRMRQ